MRAPLAPIIPSSCGSSPCVTTRTMYLPLVLRSDPRSKPTVFGLQMYGNLGDAYQALDLVQAAKVTWLRTQIEWRLVEPMNVAPEEYNYQNYDTSLRAAMHAGMNSLVTIEANPTWAATLLNGPIDRTDISSFVQFVAATVERYDGDGRQDAPGSPVVDYWEFYNEPDNGSLLFAQTAGSSYWGHNGAGYARLLCAVYPAVKAANPNARVVFGGIALDYFENEDPPFENGPFVRQFLDDVLTNGGGQCFDVMNFHYYPFFRVRWNQYGPGLIGKTTYVRNKLAQYGITDKPVICTEAGTASRNTEGLADATELQAGYVVKLFTQAKAARLDFMIWWTWFDPGEIYGDFGLLTAGGQPKLSYQTYKVAGNKLGVATFQRSLSAVELGISGVEGYLFSTPAPLYVLWSTDWTTRVATLSVGRVRVLNMLGEVIAETGTGGSARVSVGREPVYVEIVQ